MTGRERERGRGDTGRQTGRQAGRQAGRQRERESERDRTAEIQTERKAHKLPLTSRKGMTSLMTTGLSRHEGVRHLSGLTTAVKGCCPSDPPSSLAAEITSSGVMIVETTTSGVLKVDTTTTGVMIVETTTSGVLKVDTTTTGVMIVETTSRVVQKVETS